MPETDQGLDLPQICPIMQRQDTHLVRLHKHMQDVSAISFPYETRGTIFVYLFIYPSIHLLTAT